MWKKLKIDFCKFYFLNTDFSLGILKTYKKLKEVLHNIHLEGSLSQILYLGLCYIFMTLNVNNNEKIVFQIFYIT